MKDESPFTLQQIQPLDVLRVMFLSFRLLRSVIVTPADKQLDDLRHKNI